MTRTALLATAVSGLLVVAACSQESADAAPAKAAKAAAPAAAGTTAKAVLPGLWEVTRTSTDEEPEVSQDCITPEEADWSAQAAAAGAAAGNCKLLKSQVGGGRLDIRMSCGATEGTGVGTGETRMSGAYTPTTYDVDFAMSTMVNGEKVAFTTKTKGRRIAAACPA